MSWLRSLLGARSEPGRATARPVGEGPSERQWLDGHSGQGTDELLDLANRYRVDSIVQAFEAALDKKADRVGLGNLSSAERVVLVVEALEREVNHDGFGGLFGGAWRWHVPELVQALQTIGRHDVAGIAQQAIDAIGLGGALTEAALDAAMGEEDDARDRKLEDLDRQYYEVAGDLAPDVLEFIKAHREFIVLGY